MTIFNVPEFSIRIKIAVAHFSHEKHILQGRTVDINRVSCIKGQVITADGISVLFVG